MVNDDGEYSPTLDKREISLFLKRLRHYLRREYFRSTIREIMPENHFGLKFRYFLVGEYGTKTNRPHYHLIIFNLPGNLDTTHYLINQAWSKNGNSIGRCYIGSVSDQSINYVAGYVINPKDKEELRISQFALMSRNPGIGAVYLDGMKTWHQENEAFYIPGSDGSKAPMPRYLKEKIFSKISREHHRHEILPALIQAKQEEEQSFIDRGESPWLNLEQRKKQLTQRLKNQSLKNKPL